MQTFTQIQPMCQFQQLYTDSAGYVIRCHDCRHYQLLFNRTVLSITESEFQKFLEVVGSYKEEGSVWTQLKEVVLPTPCKGVYMLLSAEQLHQLWHMMDTADIESKTHSLLHLFTE